MTGSPALPDGNEPGFWAILASKVATPASPAVIVAGLAWVGVDTDFGASKNATVQLVWLGAALLLSLLAILLAWRCWIRPSGALSPASQTAMTNEARAELPAGPDIAEYRKEIRAAERGK